MKKNFMWTMAALFVSGLAFTACQVEDNPNPYPVSPMEKELVNLDFESGEVADYWALAIAESQLVTPTVDGSTGRAATIVCSKDRGDYLKIDADFTGAVSYTVDMDILLHQSPKTTQFAIVSQNAWEGWNSWMSNWGIFWKDSKVQEHTGFLFSMEYTNSTTCEMLVDIDAEGQGKNSGVQWTFENDIWYHLKLDVDIEKRTAKYVISVKADGAEEVSGTYNVPEGDSMIIKGIYERNGRFNYEPGTLAIDNVKVNALVSLF